MNHKLKVVEKAKRAAVRAYGMGIGSGTLSVKAAVNVWEAPVRSVMEYGGEIWGERPRGGDPTGDGEKDFASEQVSPK